MAASKKQEVAVWQPREFEGADLLPMGRAAAADLIDPSQLVGRDSIEEEDMILPAFTLRTRLSFSS